MSDSEDEVAERQFKICLIGDSQVGKTSIASRYATDNFGKFPSTVGVEFYLKRTVLPGPRHVTLKVTFHSALKYKNRTFCIKSTVF